MTLSSTLQEKVKLEETVQKLEVEIKSLKTAAKKLQSEKDELSGNNIALKEEVEIYKVNFNPLSSKNNCRKRNSDF